MENVYNIEKSPIFEEILTIFKSAGYGVTKHVWDASYMGVPQMRRRYFVVGKLDEKDDFHRPIPSNYVIHPADKTSDLSQVHVLTTKERSYIQSFPGSFKFVGKTSSIEQAIGNAVPVKMAEYVARVIADYP